MKIIITGGTGFLGGWLIGQWLDDGHEVLVIRNPKNTNQL